MYYRNLLFFKNIKIIAIFIIFIAVTFAYAENPPGTQATTLTLASAELETANGEINILVQFKEFINASDADLDALNQKYDSELSDKSNWKVIDSLGKELIIKDIKGGVDSKKLFIDWDKKSKLFVFYKNDKIEVSGIDTPQQILRQPDITIKFPSDSSTPTITYDLDLLRIPLKPISINGGKNGENWIAVGLSTKGDATPWDIFNNTTSLSLSDDLMYFIGDKLYFIGGSLNAGLALNGSFTEPAKQLSGEGNVELYAEIPFTDIPFVELHKATQYSRAALPLIIDSQVVFNISTVFDIRFNNTVSYEMAFAPLINIKPKFTANYVSSSNIWSGDFTVRIGTALASLTELIKIANSSDNPDNNFIFLELGGNWTGSGWQAKAATFGFATIF
jgi:hypothetical protein